MEDENSLSLRCRRVKNSLHSLASVLLDSNSTPLVPALTPVPDLPLDSNSEVDSLRQALDLERGKSQRLEELLRSQEASNAEMKDLMKELYGTIEELKSEVERLKGEQSSWELGRKQVLACQSTLSQKERLLAQVESERVQLLTELNTLKQQPRLEAETRQLRVENDQLIRDLRELETNHRDKIRDLERQITQLCDDRDQLTRVITTREAEIRDILGRQPSKEEATLLSNITQVLGLSSPEGILLALESLLSAHQRATSAVSLMQKLARLIQDCAPANTPPLPPTAKQIWRWVRRLVEEYMSLKRRSLD